MFTKTSTTSSALPSICITPWAGGEPIGRVQLDVASASHPPVAPLPRGATWRHSMPSAHLPRASSVHFKTALPPAVSASCRPRSEDAVRPGQSDHGTSITCSTGVDMSRPCKTSTNCPPSAAQGCGCGCGCGGCGCGGGCG